MTLVTRRAIDKLRGKQVVHFLHIGKTGGTAVKHALKAHLNTKKYIIKLHPHAVKLRDVPKGEKVIFIVRDPISRFVSGFYSRKRQGRPRYYSPWSPDEETAFKQFSTPNALSKALASENKEMRNAAVKAMKNIKHVNASCWDWFESEAYFLSRISDVLFIGFQERLYDDFEILKEKLGLPETVKLPKGDDEAHRNPRDLDMNLVKETITNLKEWYARDYEFVKLCRKKAKPFRD